MSIVYELGRRNDFATSRIDALTDRQFQAHFPSSLTVRFHARQLHSVEGAKTEGMNRDIEIG